MAIVRYKFDPSNPPELTPEQKARLDAMTPEEIERNAIEDPDNPPSTDEELDRGVAARAVRLARERTGLSQSQFAERFHINPARLKDWEQGRYQPDSVALAYLKVIEKDPEAVERALSAA
jgi:putative transcriptional regulator